MTMNKFEVLVTLDQINSDSLGKNADFNYYVKQKQTIPLNHELIFGVKT